MMRSVGRKASMTFSYKYLHLTGTLDFEGQALASEHSCYLMTISLRKLKKIELFQNSKEGIMR